MQHSDNAPAQETITLGWSLFEAIPDCVHLLDADGAIVALNRNGMQALEIDDPELLRGSAWRALWPDAERPVIDAARAQACAGGAGKARAFCPTARGQLKWWDVVVTRTASPDGHQAHLLAILRDITEQVAAEEERARLARQLQAASERFQKIVSQAATGVVQLDTEGRITLVNERYCAMVGRSEAELLGLSVLEVTAPESRAATLDVVARLQAGANGVAVDKYYLRRDGSRMSATSSVNALRGPRGEFEGLVAMVLDTTESKRAEETLRRLADDLAEADRHKTEFLATLAHELRNPLAPIRNGLEIMKMKGASPAVHDNVRSMMERQVGHMVHLINDLLDIARVSSGKLVLQMRPVDLRDVVATAVETSRPLLDAAGHLLEVSVPPLAVPVEVDPVRISQVLSNLLSNAAKYTPQGGRVALGVQVEGDSVLVTVADNGVGIAADMLDAVFEMFTQVARSIERSNGGLGIGLSLVRRLAELHGGSVSAHSAGVGLGSTFALRLPLAQAPAGAAPSAPAGAEAPAPGGRGRILRVLVADDNVDAAESLASLLELDGHEIRTVHDGAAAVEAAAQFRPALVFLDIGMPRLDGYEAARRMRRMPELDGAMLVALTGWGTEEDRARARAAGFDRHLLKPALPEAVQAVLAEAAGG